MCHAHHFHCTKPAVGLPWDVPAIPWRALWISGSFGSSSPRSVSSGQRVISTVISRSCPNICSHHISIIFPFRMPIPITISMFVAFLSPWNCHAISIVTWLPGSQVHKLQQELDQAASRMSTWEWLFSMFVRDAGCWVLGKGHESC